MDTGADVRYNLTVTNPPPNDTSSAYNDLGGEVRIPLYSAIFIISVVGNSLVILTLVQNARMRTVTNVFLLNLSVSDLLLTVFCMPFTLIPVLMEQFVFGGVMCRLIRYIQGVSVTTNCFTLVAISMERYFAICRPLRSRSWQTLSHSYKTIALCWFLAAVCMAPVAIFTSLKALQDDRFACRERWPSEALMKAFTIFIDLILLLFPVLIMAMSYGMIVRTLWSGMRQDDPAYTIATERDDPSESNGNQPQKRSRWSKHSVFSKTSQEPQQNCVLRQQNYEKSRAAKKRVIKMLFAVVIEFFVCWTPLYVIITYMIFDEDGVFPYITPMGMSFVHLLSYTSACCNPITYCFMNQKFRQAFIDAFVCCRKRSKRKGFHQSGSSQSFQTGSVSVRSLTGCRTRGSPPTSETTTEML